ncbi:hypothetical protein DM02DRAFT_232468 [Periconia macrospinosa]|uniref:Uncharacterized protein n=1 Tax=Periconia macrospinosa TaxID=97972 RepID=A0A2V1EBT0_9PLEO|nr:hypothetical protein DM02DRAFT_232468 [Periconia macrospinosa]
MGVWSRQLTASSGLLTSYQRIAIMIMLIVLYTKLYRVNLHVYTYTKHDHGRNGLACPTLVGIELDHHPSGLHSFIYPSRNGLFHPIRVPHNNTLFAHHSSLLAPSPSLSSPTRKLHAPFPTGVIGRPAKFERSG